MHTPPLHEPASPGPEGDPAMLDWWDGDRLLYGLPPEVQPLVLYLQSRLLRTPGADRPERPSMQSVEVGIAAVRAVREAILRAAERGAPPQRVRALHAQLDGELLLMAQEALDRGSRISRTLVRDVSHDLRSPLNSILFLADALATEHSGSLNDVQRRQVGVLYRAAQSLVGFLNDLVDVSRLGDGPGLEVVSEPFSMERVLNQVDQLLGPLARHSGVELTFRLETLGHRIGDRRVLARILVNLVSNAIQASGAGDRVEVRAADGAEGELVVNVCDTGSGADIDRLRRLIGATGAAGPRFGDEDRTWTHGLGLAICGRLVLAVSGSLHVAEGEGSGCRFTMELPFPRQ